MPSETLMTVYKLDTLGVDLALEGIQSVLTEVGVPFSGFTLYGEPLNLTEALSKLRRAKRKTFNIVGAGYEFDLSCVRNFQLDFLQINSTHQHFDWDRSVSKFIG